MTRALTLAFLLLLALPTLARQSAQAMSDLRPSQIFARARPAVVVIIAGNQNTQREALGSGFLVSRNLIATNHHVVEGMKEAYVVFSDGAVKPVSSVVADSVQQDLIILRVETGNRPPLSFGDELSLQQGDPVYALGAPKGLQLSFTNGIVSSFRKSDAQFLIQSTAPIAPGSSGGPLFDRAGRVVGVTTSMLSDAPGIYFSVGIGDVQRLLRTPQGVPVPFEEWAKQQASKPPSEPFNGIGQSQSQNGQVTAPTLQDTISWMRDFSQAHGSSMGNGHSNVVRASSQGPCIVVVDHKSQNAPDGAEQSAIEWIDLRDVDRDRVRVEEEYNLVSLESTDPSGKFRRVGNWGTHMGILETLNFADYLYFDSVESARRFANAFKRAISLCGGTASPF